MSHNAIKSYLRPLNPFHRALDVGNKVYWIQSQILCIPDRYGFFSPGPPPLQRHQACTFIAFSVPMIFGFFTLASIIVYFRVAKPDHDHPPLWGVFLVFIFVTVPFWAVVWVMNLYDKRRAPDYQWEDQKLGKNR